MPGSTLAHFSLQEFAKKTVGMKWPTIIVLEAPTHRERQQRQSRSTAAGRSASSLAATRIGGDHELLDGYRRGAPGPEGCPLQIALSNSPSGQATGSAISN